MDERRGNLVRAFGDSRVDACLLLVAQTGFLPKTDDRITRTIDAVRTDLGRDELVDRYHPEDGVEGGEGAFPQGMSHVALINAATGISRVEND